MTRRDFGQTALEVFWFHLAPSVRSQRDRWPVLPSISSGRRLGVVGSHGAHAAAVRPDFTTTDHPGDKPMPVSAPTVFVPSDSDGMYKAPERPIDRIGAILRARLMPVNQNGFDRPRATPDPSVTELVTPNAAPPSMAVALTQAADAVGADLEQLLDSKAFVTAITPVSPSDTAELQAVIREHMPAPVAPGMKPNPAQGSGGTSAHAPQSGGLLERMQAQAAKALTQPEPPGSTYREP